MIFAPKLHNTNGQNSQPSNMTLYRGTNQIKKSSQKLGRHASRSLDTLCKKKFGLGKLRVKKVWAQNICIDSLAELDNFKKINPPQPISGNPTQSQNSKIIGIRFLQLFT